MKILTIFIFCLAFAFECYGELITSRLLMVHNGTKIYGDVSIDENGMVTLLNGKNVDQAAQTFWPAVREVFKEAYQGMKIGVLKVSEIGFSFPANKSQIRMNLTERKVSWGKLVPDENSRLFWDAVCLSYSSP